MTLREKTQIISSKLKVPHEEGDEPTILKNPDLVPVPAENRFWGFWSYCGYWGTPNVTIWTWSTGSAMLGLGLNIQHTMGALTLANILICLYICLNSSPGAKYHLGYTVCQRIIFGIYGSWINVLIRVVLAIVYYGSQSWLGGLSVVVILSSFSKSYMNMKNTFSEGLNMTTRDFIGFLIFQIIQFFFYYMKPEKMHKLVNGACGITAVSFVGLLIACLAKNSGPGSIYHEPVTLSASQTGWMWLYSMTIWYGALSADITNQCDYARYAKSTKKMYFGICAGILVGGTFVPLAGLLCASATRDLYGEAMWLPTEIVMTWLQNNYSSGCRAAAFFLGLAFTASQITFNVMAHGFAGGMNLCGIFPKYINVRRGAIAIALLSWVTQPWNFYNTSSVFLTVMSSFSVVVTPIIAIIVADFKIIRKHVIPISHLYTTSEEGSFYFTKGFNFRGILVWIMNVAPGLPGLIKSVSPSASVPEGLSDFYYANIVLGFVCPFVMYIAICKVFPYKIQAPDQIDHYDAFTLEECEKLNMEPYVDTIIEGIPSGEEKIGSEFSQTKKVSNYETKYY